MARTSRKDSDNTTTIKAEVYFCKDPEDPTVERLCIEPTKLSAENRKRIASYVIEGGQTDYILK